MTAIKLQEMAPIYANAPLHTNPEYLAKEQLIFDKMTLAIGMAPKMSHPPTWTKPNDSRLDWDKMAEFLAAKQSERTTVIRVKEILWKTK